MGGIRPSVWAVGRRSEVLAQNFGAVVNSGTEESGGAGGTQRTRSQLGGSSDMRKSRQSPLEFELKIGKREWVRGTLSASVRPKRSLRGRTRTPLARFPFPGEI